MLLIIVWSVCRKEKETSMHEVVIAILNQPAEVARRMCTHGFYFVKMAFFSETLKLSTVCIVCLASLPVPIQFLLSRLVLLKLYVCMNHLGILSKCRFLLSRSKVGPLSQDF